MRTCRHRFHLMRHRYQSLKMKFTQSLLVVAACQIFISASTYARVLDKNVKYPDIDFYSLIEDQLTHLESTLGNKLSNRLIQIFEKYGMDPNLQYNSLLQMLSFVEELNVDTGKKLAGNGEEKVNLSWGKRLKKTLLSAGKHIHSKGRKYIKGALKTIVKVALRESFIHLLPQLEKINEHSIMSLKEEYRPSFARFIFNLYSKLFDRFGTVPPKSFTRESFEKKFGMEKNSASLKDLVVTSK